MSGHTVNTREANERFARLLQVSYERYFMCRIATDPDPTNETLGVSGYTMALVGEPRLDQVIRLQPDDRTTLREPAQKMGIQIGVKVTGVTFDGEPYEPAQRALVSGTVALEGENPPFTGPIFDSRNNIVGSDDNMSFVVNPFHMVIRGPAQPDGSQVTLRAADFLNPADPAQKIWEIEDPAIYARRLPTAFSASSQQVMQILRVFDQATYFNDRVRWLREQVERLKKEPPGEERDLKIQNLESRIYQIEFWGERVYTKLRFQLTYGFRTNGPQEVEDPAGLLRGRVDTSHPWPVSFWFGGWDGDLLTGYMQGTLGIPFIPDAAGAAAG